MIAFWIVATLKLSEGIKWTLRSKKWNIFWRRKEVIKVGDSFKWHLFNQYAEDFFHCSCWGWTLWRSTGLQVEIFRQVCRFYIRWSIKKRPLWSCLSCSSRLESVAQDFIKLKHFWVHDVSAVSWTSCRLLAAALTLSILFHYCRLSADCDLKAASSCFITGY